MDIKWKNSRNFHISLIVAGLLLVTVVNVGLTPWILKNAGVNTDTSQTPVSEELDQYQANALYHGAYVLYAELNGNVLSEEKTGFYVTVGTESLDLEYEGFYDYLSDWSDEFEQYRAELDYYATDGTHSGKNTDIGIEQALDDGFSMENAADSLKDAYRYYFALIFDENGTLSVEVWESGNVAADALIKALLAADRSNGIRTDAQEEGYEFVSPKNFTVVYGITEDSFIFGGSDGTLAYRERIANGGANSVYLVSLAVVIVFALVMASKKIHFPKGHYMELGVIGLIFSVTYTDGGSGMGIYLDLLERLPEYDSSLSAWWKNVQMWQIMQEALLVFAFYAIAFCSVMALCPVISFGVRGYVKEYSFFYQIFPWIKGKWKGFEREVDHIDLGDKTTKILLKIVLANFAVLLVLMGIWASSGWVVVLVIYSVVLFFLLRKHYEKIAADYRTLMRATSRIADGDLDTVITEDIGIFEPFKAELAKIRIGFKKAVDEEVKSQRMKTELITNVSHDLKTPLTAITTYVALLKNENLTAEERKNYVATLEKKALRLKVLIEDLFEISKATSNNITLNLMDVDVVNLIKQVSIEHTDRFEAQSLQLKWSVPDEKVILRLDNQKTYRIFENLFVNVQKYAMPGSRVYLSVEKRGAEVVITMKNMSQAELSTRGDELTERFVRGDSSRGTEGSGLGLAIAKSFTEAQKGTFAVSVDGDLFKVVITLQTEGG